MNEEFEEDPFGSEFSDEEEKWDLDAVMGEMENPVNLQRNETEMNHGYFKLHLKNHFKVFTFEKNHVSLFYDLLVNFVGQELTLNSKKQMFCQVLSPY